VNKNNRTRYFATEKKLFTIQTIHSHVEQARRKIARKIMLACNGSDRELDRIHARSQRFAGKHQGLWMGHNKHNELQ
jgi:hypothetical protein